MNNRIVHSSNDTPAQLPSWLVAGHKRRRIKTIPAYFCLIAQGRAPAQMFAGGFLYDYLRDRGQDVTTENSCPSSQSAPPPPPPPPPSPPPSVRGFTIEDSFLGGTWARTDPNNGTWYSRGNRPANGAYWYPNGLGVGVDCGRAAAAYVVRFTDGHSENWNTWFHVTDGKWFPSAAARETRVNGLYGLRGC